MTILIATSSKLAWGIWYAKLVVLGHAEIGTTIDVYTHLSALHLQNRSEVASLDAILDRMSAIIERFSCLPSSAFPPIALELAAMACDFCTNLHNG